MIKIPFKLVAGIILISVTADDKEGFFAFDSGAMQTAVNKAYFPKIQGKQVNITKFSEGVKENSAEEGTLNNLRFSEIVLTAMPVLVMDLMYVEKALKATAPDIKFLGTLGIDVIKNYTVMLDYNADEIILNPAHGFESEMIIPMKFNSLPIITVKIAERICDFVLDTGSSICLLSQSFQDVQQLIPVSSSLFTIPIVSIGENEYQNITATITDIEKIKKKVPVEGVIGYQVLSPQRTILDFQNKELIMEKMAK